MSESANRGRVVSRFHDVYCGACWEGSVPFSVTRDPQAAAETIRRYKSLPKGVKLTVKTLKIYER